MTLRNECPIRRFTGRDERVTKNLIRFCGLKKRDAPAGVVIRNSEEVKRGYVGSMYEKYIKSIYQGTYKYFENRQDEANS